MSSSPPTTAQYLDAYVALQVRVCELLSSADGSTAVPSCPEWSVRDVLAHLVGLCEDWVGHRLDGYASASWTARQVARYGDVTLTDLSDRWTGLMRDFARLDDDPQMGPPARWAFGDAVVHEADLRGALAAGRVPADAVLLSLKGSIARWREVLNRADPPITLVVRPTDAREWILGTTATDPTLVVTPTAYELFRALAGRRSRNQVGAWPWSADPDRILKLGLPYPFQWARTDITD
jgi:uncharacterized protein (TIGR03083 family)